MKSPLPLGGSLAGGRPESWVLDVALTWSVAPGKQALKAMPLALTRLSFAPGLSAGKW